MWQQGVKHTRLYSPNQLDLMPARISVLMLLWWEAGKTGDGYTMYGNSSTKAATVTTVARVSPEQIYQIFNFSMPLSMQLQ